MPRNDQVTRQWLLLQALEKPGGATIEEIARSLPPEVTRLGNNNQGLLQDKTEDCEEAADLHLGKSVPVTDFSDFGASSLTVESNVITVIT